MDEPELKELKECVDHGHGKSQKVCRLVEKCWVNSEKKDRLHSRLQVKEKKWANLPPPPGFMDD